MKVRVGLKKEEKAAILATMDDCGIFPLSAFLRYAALYVARKGGE